MAGRSGDALVAWQAAADLPMREAQRLHVQQRLRALIREVAKN